MYTISDNDDVHTYATATYSNATFSLRQNKMRYSCGWKITFGVTFSKHLISEISRGYMMCSALRSSSRANKQALILIS